MLSTVVFVRAVLRFKFLPPTHPEVQAEILDQLRKERAEEEEAAQAFDFVRRAGKRAGPPVEGAGVGCCGSRSVKVWRNL